MISIHEWRRLHEMTDQAVELDAQPPTDEDKNFYKQAVRGQMGRYLGWLIAELRKNNPTLAKKGFIVQEVMKALDLDLPHLQSVWRHVRDTVRQMEVEGDKGRPAANPFGTAAPATPAQTATPSVTVQQPF